MMTPSTSHTSTSTPNTDLKIDLAEGCDAILDMLGEKLNNESCKTIVRVDVGYLHNNVAGQGASTLVRNPDNIVRLTDDELMLIFQGIVCCLPNIKTVIIMSYFRSDALSLPVSALEMLFRRAVRLEILFLHQIKLHGSNDDFNEKVPRAIQQHPSLKRINLHCCGASVQDGNREENDMALDAMVSSFAALPSLYYLSLDQAPISSTAIAALTNSKNLKDLSFYNMPVVKSCLHILLDALQKSKSKMTDSNLQALRLRSCDLDNEEADMIATMMETNESLESLVFYCNRWDNYGASLGKSLEKNTTMKRLEVGIGQNNTIQNLLVEERNSSEYLVTGKDDTTSCHEQSARRIAKALENNTETPLRHLCLCFSNDTGDELYDAYMPHFEQMLESNYTLESFLLQGKDSFSVLSPKVAFLMNLNKRSGLDRRRLFRDVDNELHSKSSVGNNRNKQKGDPWFEALILHKEDISVLFYLLSRNPGLLVGP